jgi:hypothetical protein
VGDAATSSSANREAETGTAKIKTWLAISGGVIGLLAFFGISNFDQLKHALFGNTAVSTTAHTSPSTSSANATACNLTQQAEGNSILLNASTAQYEAGLQAESGAFSNASNVAVDQKLRADLENAAHAAQQSSQTLATDAGQEWLNELNADMRVITTDCINLG